MNLLIREIFLGHNIFPALPVEHIEKHIANVKQGITKRWQTVENLKSSFTPFAEKSDSEILEEFNHLHAFRQRLWYRNPNASPRITTADYMPSQRLLETGHYRTVNNVAFDYNVTDGTYNASTVLITGHHFLALQEPNESNLNQFFKILINNHAGILVRVKTSNEFLNHGAIKYWENRLKGNSHPTYLQMIIKEYYDPVEPVEIPYFYTDNWIDDKALDVVDLYNLVVNVRAAYDTLGLKGPIACHCASGVGRTGTFIAAYVIADLISNHKIKDLSIEELVLRLSIQRPNLVGTKDQYLSLYRFTGYCLKQHSS